MKYLILILIYTAISNYTFSQEDNEDMQSQQQEILRINATYFYSAVNYFHSPFLFIKHTDTISLDTTLIRFSNYLPSDTMVAYQTPGVPGMVVRNLKFKNDLLLIREDGYNKYLEHFRNEKLLINTNSRFSRLKYVLGSGKEQYLDVLHSQNVLSRLNLSIIYKRISSEGFLRRQFTKQSSFVFYPWYYSRNKNYSVFLNLSIKNNEFQENGGVGEDSISAGNDLDLLPISLESAQNKTKKFSVEIMQKKGFKKHINDSLYLHNFTHKSSFINEKNNFIDNQPLNEFYPIYYYDSTITDDLLEIKKLLNVFQYMILPDRLTGLSIYVVNNLMEVNQRSLDTILNNYYTGINFSRKFNSVDLHLRGEYGISGSYTEEFLIKSDINYIMSDDYQLNLNYTQYSKFPDLIFTVFQSNHFSWYKNLERTNTQKYSFNFHANKLNTNLSIDYISIDNYTYFNELAQPDQFNKTLNRLDVGLKNLLKIGRFGLESNVLYLYAREDSIISLPELSLRSNLFYENYLLNRSLFAKVGVGLDYMSGFKGDAYMPALRQFYLQNKIIVAGYPRFNFFINLKIKTASIFLKVENLNSGLNDDFFCTVPNYPMPGTVLKLGIDWKFFD